MQLSKNHPGILRPKAEGQGKVYTGASHPAADQPGLAAGLVGVPGVEPGTSSLSGTRSNQLSYTPFADTPAQAARANEARRVVEATGFEPVTPSLQSSCSTN
jgi:hypothetical protein